MVDEPMPRRIKERFAELLPLGRTDVLGRYRDSGDRDERLIPFRARVLDIDFDLASEAVRVTDLNLEIEADGLVNCLGHALEHGSTQVIRIVDCVAQITCHWVDRYTGEFHRTPLAQQERRGAEITVVKGTQRRRLKSRLQEAFNPADYAP